MTDELRHYVAVDRKVRTYAIQESELNSLTILNSVAMLLFSFGGFCLSITVNIATGTLTAGAPISGAATFAQYASLVVATMCYGIGGWTLWRGRSQIAIIKKECDPEETDGHSTSELRD